MSAPRRLTSQERHAAAALREFAAIVRDVAHLPGERPAWWWESVRRAVCAAHGVPDFGMLGQGRRHARRALGIAFPGDTRYVVHMNTNEMIDRLEALTPEDRVGVLAWFLGYAGEAVMVEAMTQACPWLVEDRAA